MKKLIFSLFLIGLSFAIEAQTAGYLLLSPDQNRQSFLNAPLGTANQQLISTGSGVNWKTGWGYDSSNVASQAAGDTVRSAGYFTTIHYFSLSAAVKYTGAIVMPSSPIKGQTVIIVSNKKFFHLFTTNPASITTDTGGSQQAVFVYDGKYWHMVN